jgi:hypothetical protein
MYNIENYYLRALIFEINIHIIIVNQWQHYRRSEPVGGY